MYIMILDKYEHVTDKKRNTLRYKLICTSENQCEVDHNVDFKKQN